MRASRRYLCIALSLFALLLTSSIGLAQGFPQPGAEHEKLKERLAGEWVATLKMPDGSESEGKASMRMELGGLWLVSEFKADLGGVAFEGKGRDSYDTNKKKYVSYWIDSMSTSQISLSGDFNKEGDLVMEGTGPGEDGKPTSYRSVNKFVDADNHTFEMYMGDSKEPSIVVKYRRKK